MVFSGYPLTRRLGVRQSAGPVSAKEIDQAELSLGDEFRERIRDSLAVTRQLLEVSFELGEVGRFAKFGPGPRSEGAGDRLSLPDLPRQGLKLIRHSPRFFHAPKKQ